MAEILGGPRIAERFADLTKEVPGLSVGAALIPRGEFAIVILGLAAVADPTLGALVTAYVFILATTGPLIARLTGPAPASST